MTAQPTPQPISQERWHELCRRLLSGDVDWELLLQLLEDGRTGRVELNVHDGRVKNAYIHLRLSP